VVGTENRSSAAYGLWDKAKEKMIADVVAEKPRRILLRRSWRR